MTTMTLAAQVFGPPAPVPPALIAQAFNPPAFNPPAFDPPSFVPLALEMDDILTYGRIADVVGCEIEVCAEGFMHATPLAREAAVRLWQGWQALQARAESDAELAHRVLLRARAEQARDALASLLGLDPAMPPAALAAVGLRYVA